MNQYFTHERGRYMAVYALALGYSNGIAPLISGFINKGQGWRWVPVILPYKYDSTSLTLDSTGARYFVALPLSYCSSSLKRQISGGSMSQARKPAAQMEIGQRAQCP